MKTYNIAGIELKMAYPPSKEQIAAGEALIMGDTNIVLDAKAGAGKTTTIQILTDILLKEEPEAKILMIAFNKSIVEELQERMNSKINIRTSHSLGMSILNSNAAKRDGRLSLNGKKVFEVLQLLVKVWEWDMEQEENQEKFNTIRKLCDLARLNLCHTPDQIKSIAAKHDLEIFGKEAEETLLLMKQLEKDKRTIDFVDMIYKPYLYADKLDFPKYDYVFVDECQDLNVAQHKLMENCIKEHTGRFIAVGDPHQCQPAGTKVHMTDGSTKNIEDVKIGEHLIGYTRASKCNITGRYLDDKTRNRYLEHAPTVEKVRSHRYTGKTYKIAAGDRESKYTGNHICYAKWKKTDNPKYALYLMQKDNNFRVGIYKILGEQTGNFGINSKSRSEGADKTWILEIYDTRSEAYLNEQLISYRFGIPQLIFQHNNQKKTRYVQKDLDKFWGVFQNDYKQVANCLGLHNKDFLYPLWEKGKKSYNGTKSFQEYRACNLFAKYMSVAFLTEEKTPTTVEIDTIEVKTETLKVYSLQVSKTQNYFADGILTHNCIYGFAGADTESFKKLQQSENTITLPLNECYRCTKSIIKFVQEKTGSNIVAFKKNADGEEPRAGSVEELKDGDFVMCRNTYPLVKLCFHLLGQGIAATVRGRDIGANLQNIIKASKRSTLDALYAWMDKDMSKRYQKLCKKNPHMNEQEIKDLPAYAMEIEKHHIIKLIAQSNDTVRNCEQLKWKIQEIFTDNPKGGILLSTIHKAKGLEFDRCFIIEKELMPSKRAKLDWQLEQERNLEYVCYTRAKKELIFIEDWTAGKGYSGKSKAPARPESKHVGIVGEKTAMKCKIIDTMEQEGNWGTYTLYEMEDEQGNIIVKFGTISDSYMTGDDTAEFTAEIKQHKQFRGENRTIIGRLSKFK